MAKLYDLAVKTGTYTNSNGDEKGRYKNVGAVMEGRDGGMFILLDRTFNPAGVGEGEACLISMFEPKQRGQSNNNQAQHGQAHHPPQQQSFGGMNQDGAAPRGDYGTPGNSPDDDSIPF